MKLHELLLGINLALATPLLFAQTPAPPATPAAPATPTAPPAPKTDQPLSGSGGATADPNSGQAAGSLSGKSDFGTLDVNGDGRLSKDELKGNTAISSHFSELDKNSDGKLSRAEYQGALKATPGG